MRVVRNNLVPPLCAIFTLFPPPVFRRCAHYFAVEKEVKSAFVWSHNSVLGFFVVNGCALSRRDRPWPGIPVPVGFDQEHVMYVWFDALTNYLSGVHALVSRWSN